jgi:hypothetical protein
MWAWFIDLISGVPSRSTIQSRSAGEESGEQTTANGGALQSTDLVLSILQRIAIVAGIVIGGLYYLVQEDGKPRIVVEITARSLGNCWAAVDVNARNLGSSIVTLTDQSVTMTRLVPNGSSVDRLLVAEQLLAPDKVLRSREQTNWVSVIRGQADTTADASASGVGEESTTDPRSSTCPKGLHITSFLYRTSEEKGDPSFLRSAEHLVDITGC